MAATLAEPASHARAVDLLSVGRSAERLAAADKPGEPSALNPGDPLPALAESAFNEALRFGQASSDSLAVSEALGEQGHFRELAHDDDAALRLTHKAQFAAASAGPYSLYRWQWQAGRILAHQGDSDGALIAYRNAAATLAPIRSDLVLGYGNLRDGNKGSTFRQSVGPLLFELSGLILQKAATLSGPEAQAALIEARQTIEQLKSSEIQDYFKDDCVVTARAVAKDIGTLDPHTAVIYFIPLPDHLEILVQTAGGMTRRTSPVGSEALFATVHRNRDELEDRTQYAYLTESQQLYDWLIAPIAEELRSRKIDTLVFVPDGALLSVPMASLFDGKDYLIEHFAIAITPGLTLMDPRPIPRGEARVLAGGLSMSRSGFSALPHVAEELALVEHIYGGSMLVDQAFIGSRLEHEIQSYPFTIIHLASHAEFLGQSSMSFLLTYDGRLSLDDLQHLIAPTALPSRGRLRPIELLTLSACQTASGDDRAALGLAGVALKAGARSVLATLWSVNDEAQGALVADVYARLRDDRALSKAKALRLAQLKLLKRYPHAYYWSAQVLIGNWL
jgi:CHAT domain-containing protein